jgi:DNA-directed RNA polymerase
MPTPAQIDEQIELERDQIAQGLKKLRDNTRQLEQKEYASASIYGATSIEALLPLVVKTIEDTFSYKIKRGKNGVAFKDVHQYLSDIEPLALAAIACKLTFDKVFGAKLGCNTASNVCEAIGVAVERECQMRHYQACAPGLLESLKKNYWHASIGTHQKIRVITTMMNRCNVEAWKPWHNTLRIALGGWLLDCIMKPSGWFFRSHVRFRSKTIAVILPTPEFLEIKDKVITTSELFSPEAWPMLIEPNDWSNEKAGGYLLNEVMKGHKMVRRGDDGLIQGDKPIEFLNKIQKVGYRLNLFTVDVAKYLQEKGISVGKFIPIVEIPLPPKPVDIADNKEARKSYRRAAADVMNKNANAFRRACRTRMTMEAVRRFEYKQRFYIPWSFDYRGRAYPIPAFLTPQDTDFGKSLIRFADESVITGNACDWLSFQCATTYGLDKATMTERLEWTDSNIALISRVALNPIDNIGDWEGAEEPWQFLAACDEYYHCIIARDKHTTGLPVATDATCSGLQILAGLARDKSTAQLVNVLPADRPQDAYKVVAEVSKWNIPDRLRDIWDRKCVKRTVMTIPYNAKPFSNRTYIRDALAEKDVTIDKEELTITVQAVRMAMNNVVPGPMAVMKWIETEVSKVIRSGAEEIKWTTPSGFKVSQRLNKREVQTIRLQLLGRCELEVANEGDEVSLMRHKAATAPNLIHSLDASLLHLSATRFNAPIALIHDSVLCRATDMTTLSNLVRETYMDLFAKQDYLTDFAQQIGAESKPPIIGDLEPSTVIDSTYFFC